MIAPALQRELDSRADAAVAYGTLDWSVLPAHGVRSNGCCTCDRWDCDRPGKHPARTNYKAMATTDAMTLRSYWRIIPFNLALLIDASVIVIDVDDLTAFDTMRRFRPWPVTPTVTTARGMHLYFRWPLDGASPSVGGLDRSKVDVKGSDELVTLPPSTGRDGFRYTWRDGESPWDIPLASVPLAFAEHAARIVAKRTAAQTSREDVTTLDGALKLAHRRAGYASRTSNGAGRGKAGLSRTLTEAGASSHVITAALDAFTAEAGR
jgi:hypothetical protein